MLGLGKKKVPSLDQFPADNWTVAQGECDGRPLVIRINTAAKKFVAHPQLATRLGVTVPFHSPNENGFCAKEEGDQVGKIEDQLCDALAADKTGFLVLVITTNGAREFVFYVRDAARAQAAAKKAASQTSTHKLQFGTLDDPEWSYFAQFA